VGKALCVPAQTIVESKIAPNFPSVLSKQRDVFISNAGLPGLVEGFIGRCSSVLKIEEQWSTRGRGPGGAGLARGRAHIGYRIEIRIITLDGRGTKARRISWRDRGVM